MAAPEWVVKLIDKSGMMKECMKLMKEMNESQEKAVKERLES